MPKNKSHHCKFCHSVTDAPGLCGTCQAFFKRHREVKACRCSADGYSFHIPRPEPGQTIRITIEGGAP